MPILKTYLTMNLLFIFILSSFGLLPEVSSSHSVDSLNPMSKENSMEDYCNNKFNFCVTYPELVFEKSLTATNKDGLTLSTSNNGVIFKIYGEQNALNYTLKEQHYFLLKTLEEEHGSIEDHLTVYTDKGFNTNIDMAGRKIEIRCQQFQDYFVTVIIKIFDIDNPMYKNLTDEIKVKISI